MPSKRWRKIKTLLKEKKTTVIDTKPFIVKLLYDAKTKETQNLTIGIDPGRTKIERTYKLNGKVVAKNRRKRIGQTFDSLHEWYIKTKYELGLKATKQLQSKLKVVKSTKHYRDINKHIVDSIFFHKGKRKIISGTLTNGTYYRTIGDSKPIIPQRKILLKKTIVG